MAKKKFLPYRQFVGVDIERLNPRQLVERICWKRPRELVACEVDRLQTRQFPQVRRDGSGQPVVVKVQMRQLGELAQARVYFPLQLRVAGKVDILRERREGCSVVRGSVELFLRAGRILLY